MSLKIITGIVIEIRIRELVLVRSEREEKIIKSKVSFQLKFFSSQIFESK
jgi:hypothetical protein